MLWVDQKYANMLGVRLNKFKVKKQNPFLANCRCPYCGDSDYSKNKARGFIFVNKGSLVFKCHNCGLAIPFAKLLKDQDPAMHAEYKLETIKELSGNHERLVRPAVGDQVFTPDMSKFAKRQFEKNQVLGDMKRISQLPVDHPARQYVVRRQIPHNQHFRLYYCPKFVAFTNGLVPGKITNMREHPRLLIPMVNSFGEIMGYQGRSFDPKETLRYITIMLMEDMPKVFGLDQVKLDDDIFVVEGPLDSLFLPNSVAMAGSDIDPSRFARKENIIFVYDNEPRSRIIVKKMKTRIEEGYKVMIWPSNIEQKDINDMIVKGGLCLEELSGILFRRTFSGMRANLELSQWSKT
jgi:hypothetical protein